jgi:two-component system, LytTR family, response regulator LytT
MAGIKVGIVEDEMLIAQGIANALSQLGYASTEPAVGYTEALEMIEREQPDILLLDIQLSGKKDGIDLAWKIKEDYNLPFIFLTANSDPETVERAKKLCPPAYLVKPFNKDDLYTSIEICLHNFSAKQEKKDTGEKGNYMIKECLFIKQGHLFHKVKVEDILYLESDNVYIYVYTPNDKFLVRSTLQHYLNLIDSKHFFRVHRSFAVNINHIDTINSESVFISSREIPIGKAYRDELLTLLRLG